MFLLSGIVKEVCKADRWLTDGIDYAIDERGRDKGG